MLPTPEVVPLIEQRAAPLLLGVPDALVSREVADGGRVRVAEPAKHDRESLSDVWTRLLETVHPPE